jgi:RNA polymerase sigma factor (sigma-70 family)
MIRYSDEAIIEGLKLRREEMIKYVYRDVYPVIRNLVISNSGTDEDAEDIFQDALVIVYKKSKNEELILSSSFKTFFYSVCKHLWLQRLGKLKDVKQLFIEIEEPITLPESITKEMYVVENEKFKLYQKHFLSLGDDCQKVLRLFLRKMSLREIAEVMGYKTEKYAKTRKYDCKEELKSRILNDPTYLNLIADD